VKVTWLSADLQEWQDDGDLVIGGSGWYRSWLPASALAEAGYATAVVGKVVQLESGWLAGVDKDGNIVEPSDVLVIQRWHDEKMVGAVETARYAGQAIVVDVDDHWEMLPADHPAHRGGNQALWHRQACRAATACISSTPYLADRVTKLNRRVSIIPNAITGMAEWAHARQTNTETLHKTVGWFGVPRLRGGDLQVMRHILADALEEYGWRFRHIGHIDGEQLAHELLGIPDELADEPLPVVIPNRLPQAYAGLGLVIVPMADIPFNRAKSWQKGLEAGAAGLPFIASRIPSYDELGASHLPQRPRDWIRTLDMVLGSEDVRRNQAERAMAAAREHTMVQAMPMWERALLRAVIDP
jgi:hypothetical protein